MSTPLNRRKFFHQSTLWVGTAALAMSTRKLRASASEKLNLGVIGVAGRGGENLQGVADQNIVALCDVDANLLAAAGQKFPQAKRYSDYRKMLEQKDIQAVVVSSPDHNHAVMTVAALKSGRHVYCEKPLTHTISEARIVARTAQEEKKITQMGNQIHASNNYRRVVELLQSGAIGKVSEVHVWVDMRWETKPRPTPAPVPGHLDYDLWLGPVEYRPYSPEYVPFNWRRWWAFGGGTLADFCCHHIDLTLWAFNLTAPKTIETEGPAVNEECAPPELTVRYEFPTGLKLTWYHGGRRPPHFAEGKLPKWGNGSLYIGDKGMLLADYGKYVLLPEEKFKGFTPPAPFIPDSIGHHKEWVEACKKGAATTCHFGYGAALTEVGLLGNVAFRVGKKIEWDAKAMKAVNCPEADRFIQHHYRQGWKI